LENNHYVTSKSCGLQLFKQISSSPADEKDFMMFLLENYKTVTILIDNRFLANSGEMMESPGEATTTMMDHSRNIQKLNKN